MGAAAPLRMARGYLSFAQECALTVTEKGSREQVRARTPVSMVVSTNITRSWTLALSQAYRWCLLGPHSLSRYPPVLTRS